MRESRPEAVLTEPVPSLWERAISIGIIAMLTGALIGPVFAPLQEETPVLRLVWLPAYAAIFGMAAFRIDRLWRAWPAVLAMVAVVGLAFASKYWSIDYGVTSRRVIALAISCVFALYLGAVFRGAHLPAPADARRPADGGGQSGHGLRLPRPSASTSTTTPACGAASGTRRTRWGPSW